MIRSLDVEAAETVRLQCWAILLAAWLGASSVLLSAPATAAADSDLIERGGALVDANCSRCHAVGSEGSSPLAAAPLFRTLGERYPITDLEEALAEGIVSGHPAMPEFVFEPDEVAAIIAYIESLQKD